MNLHDLDVNVNDIDPVIPDDEDEDIEGLPPRRPVKVKVNPAHRQLPATSQKPTGTSWWLGKSREELNTEAVKRLPEMRGTKQALSVKGTSREA